MPPLIIFDCDGVLVDSEHLANRSLVESLVAHEIHIDPVEATERFKGRKLADCLAEIERAHARKLPESFETEFRARMGEYFELHLKPVPGAPEAVAALPHPKCVASNGPLFKTKRNLEITGLAPHFGENVFSAYTIQKWKPEPDLFLHAAKTMGFAPENTVVVEDSESGVRAALAGGFRVLALGFTAVQHDKLRPFNHMSELPELLKKLS